MKAVLTLMDVAKSWETECGEYERQVAAGRKASDERTIGRLFEAQKRTLQQARDAMVPFIHRLWQVQEWKVPPVAPDEDPEVRKCRYLNLSEKRDEEGNLLTEVGDAAGLAEALRNLTAAQGTALMRVRLTTVERRQSQQRRHLG